ncbi:MAG: histone H1 [Gammaproteobacteria bacterium]|nr:histone H1 [Gammaproteobacteria bacterium]
MDINQTAKRVVDIATGQADAEPQPAKPRAKGGKARASALPPERRSEIARNAAQARWQRVRAG